MAGLSHRQYMQECAADEDLDEEDYQGVPYPHPYLSIWLECKRYPTPQGTPSLPEPEKGPLDQDADVMAAFEVLEEAHMAILIEEEARKQNKAAAQSIDGFSFMNDE